jgi:PAS domain S-box-containing protein
MSEAGRQHFFDRCPLPAAIVGPDGLVEAANPAWKGVVGWSPEELVGRPLHGLLHPQDRLPAARPDSLEGVWTARCLRPDGSTLRLAWSVVAGPDGRHYCVARQPESEERRSQERFKAEFINLAAHALNTPLTPIQLALDTLDMQAQGCLSPEARQSMSLVQRNFRRLRDVVAELLDTARLQAGRMPLELREADLSALVAEAVEEKRRAAEEAGVALRERVEPGLQVVVDAGRLRQVLGAYLECALACAQAGGEVRLEAGRSDGEATVSVNCAGSRLTAEQRDRLFHPFPTHDDAVAPPRVGTGLGLYMARGIIELHGGRAAAPRSEPEGGLGLRFTLPLEGPSAFPAPTAEVRPVDAGTAVH